MRKNAFRKLCLGAQSRLHCDFFKPRYASLFLQTQELHYRRLRISLLQPCRPDMRCWPNSFFLNLLCVSFSSYLINVNLLKNDFILFCMSFAVTYHTTQRRKILLLSFFSVRTSRNKPFYKQFGIQLFDLILSR